MFYIGNYVHINAITPLPNTEVKSVEVQQLAAITTLEQLKQEPDEHNFLFMNTLELLSKPKFDLIDISKDNRYHQKAKKS